MHLTLDGWIVIRIGYDDLLERPKVWQQLLLQLIGRLFGTGGNATEEAYDRDMETVKLALRLGRPIRLTDIQGYFGCGYRTSRQIADRLQECGLFQAVGGGTLRSHAWKPDGNHPRFPKLL
ncbi:hypothetical protein [Cohnella candidum]|nr:hypothetical protein [Cohnella candidum]